MWPGTFRRPVDNRFPRGSGCAGIARRPAGTRSATPCAPTTTPCGSVGRRDCGNFGCGTNGVDMVEGGPAEVVGRGVGVGVRGGDPISKGGPVVVVESMKMGIPGLAEVAGTVSKVSVSVGDV